MAAALYRPGLCATDRALAESTALVRLPDDDQIASLPSMERRARKTCPTVIEAARTASR